MPRGPLEGRCMAAVLAEGGIYPAGRSPWRPTSPVGQRKMPAGPKWTRLTKNWSQILAPPSNWAVTVIPDGGGHSLDGPDAADRKRKTRTNEKVWPRCDGYSHPQCDAAAWAAEQDQACGDRQHLAYPVLGPSGSPQGRGLHQGLSQRYRTGAGG